MAVTLFEEHAPLRREGSPRHQLTARAPPLIGCRQRATCRRTPAKGSASSTDTTYWNLKRCKNLCALLVGGRPSWSAGAECYRRYQNCYPIRWDALGKRTIEERRFVEIPGRCATAWDWLIRQQPNFECGAFNRSATSPQRNRRGADTMGEPRFTSAGRCPAIPARFPPSSRLDAERERCCSQRPRNGFRR